MKPLCYIFNVIFHARNLDQELVVETVQIQFNLQQTLTAIQGCS